MKTTKIILDTDMGSEMTDAATLTLAAISPEIELLGVTTVTHDSVFRASVAKKFLDLLGRKEIPVSSGFGTSGDHKWEKEIIFPDGYEPSKELDLRSASQLILDLVNENKGDITLVGIGTTTNIAEALAKDSDLPNKVKGLILMGGMIEQPVVDGKIIPRGFEYNFCNDSLSIEKIIKAGFKSPGTNVKLNPALIIFSIDRESLQKLYSKPLGIIFPSTTGCSIIPPIRISPLTLFGRSESLARASAKLVVVPIPTKVISPLFSFTKSNISCEAGLKSNSFDGSYPSGKMISFSHL